MAPSRNSKVTYKKENNVIIKGRRGVWEGGREGEERVSGWGLGALTEAINRRKHCLILMCICSTLCRQIQGVSSLTIR